MTKKPAPLVEKKPNLKRVKPATDALFNEKTQVGAPFSAPVVLNVQPDAQLTDEDKTPVDRPVPEELRPPEGTAFPADTVVATVKQADALVWVCKTCGNPTYFSTCPTDGTKRPW